MKDNIVYIILGTTLAIGAINEEYKEENLPRAAAWYQEGKSIKQEPSVKSIVDEPIYENKIDGVFSEPGEVSHLADVGATGPPKQDGYPRSPKEIRAILEGNKNEFGLLHN